jgi:RHS repeat-associated protein
MCPSIAVLAGGGDGGGGSGGSGGDGSGDDNAGTSSGGENADGDGKSAGSCGGGAPGGCTNCGHNISRGDPVDAVTGRTFTVPALDLSLPGPIPLDFTRAYSSSAHERDLGLGHGWNHSFGWRIEVQRRAILVTSGEGSTVEFPPIDRPGESAQSLGGWRLRREQSGFTLDAKDELLRLFIAEDAGPAPTRFVLAAVEDSARNRIALSWDAGHLVLITDSVGREIRVGVTSAGRIASLSVKNAPAQGRWIAFATYSYDDRGDLVGMVDADGHAWRYAYDEDHLLTEHEDPTGLVFHYVYDVRHRCIETWGDYPGKADLALSADAPRFLADHTTVAKGVLHCKLDFHDDGYIEVVDSLTVQRLFANAFGTIDKGVTGGAVTTNVFDDRGNLLARTDPLGALTQYEWDDRGRLTRSTDPLGRSTVLGRDAEGRVTEVADPAGNLWRLTRTPTGKIETLTNPRGAVWAYRYDARGQLTEEIFPNGSREILRRDGHGNVVERVAQNGAVFRYAYDYLGTWIAETDPLGAVTRALFTDGRVPTAFIDPLGGVTRISIDGAGKLTELIDPEGRAYRIAWGGNHWYAAMTYPDGTTFARRYDREGHLVEVHNERGEVQRRGIDARGNVVEETTFDGRKLTFKYDAMGRLTRRVNGAGEKTEYAYNEAGELVGAELPDESAEHYEYDLRGQLVGMRGKGFVVERLLDEVGNVLREIQTVDDEALTVEYSYDLMDTCVRRATSLGHTLEVTPDAAGLPARSLLDGATEVLHTRDALGREIERRLPGGGAMHKSFDAVGQLVRQWARSSRARGPGAERGEPAWIGGEDTGVSAGIAYAYTPAGDMSARWIQGVGTTRYEYDLRDRLLAAIPDQGLAERFRYDPTGNVAEVGAAARTYDSGNRLGQRGTTVYSWDADGRLAEKRVKQPDGSDASWRYAWNGQGRLARVSAPDGTVLTFVYDALGRRLAKRVQRPAAPGRSSVAVQTRFVWDRSALVHEIRREAMAIGDPVIEERTYCFEEHQQIPFPWAHREQRRIGEQRSESPWYYYFDEPAGSPEQLVDGDGAVVETSERGAFLAGRTAPGAPTSTPLRFAGQYEDEETGLYYNRFRYYDPETGRYISADPSGLRGGNNLYSYACNPVGWIDPWGLHRVSVEIVGGPKLTNPETGNNTWRNVPGSSRSPGRCDDSEQRVLDHLRNNNVPVDGKVIKMHAIGSGGLPPCPQCAAAMQKFCTDNNCTIVYSRGNENSGRSGVFNDIHIFRP